MESTPIAGGYSSYQPTFDDELGEAQSGQSLQSGPEVSLTQPVASKPVEPKCGDADQDDSAFDPLGRFRDRDDGSFSYDGKSDSARPL
jgi:hypothetical protein